MAPPIGTCKVEIQQVNQKQPVSIDRFHLTWKAEIGGLSLRNCFLDSLFHSIALPAVTDQCTFEWLLWYDEFGDAQSLQ